MQTANQNRCFGNKPNQALYAAYHDNEWGRPVYDDRILFEMLILEGAQAGLNWETILKKRAAYCQSFYDFDVHKVASMSDGELDNLRNNSGIIRNRLKINAARKNAQIFLAIQKEHGTFATFVWSFVNNQPIKNHWHALKDVPVSTPESCALSKALIKYGMSFVGPTIIYAFMQAVGMVNDHLIDCPLYDSNKFQKT
jgi:DNA-3-methyladenine glycosylase I